MTDLHAIGGRPMCRIWAGDDIETMTDIILLLVQRGMHFTVTSGDAGWLIELTGAC